MKKILVRPLILLLLSGGFFQQSCRDNTSESVVIMLSMDGFRWDYPDIYETPNLDKIAVNGVKATSLIPSYPTKTFPNHYSMATGLYPDHHGIVNNSFYCPEKDVIYRIGNRSMVEDSSFYGGEPVWVTAEKQGIPTASFFWVGSEAAVKGYHPGIWKPFDSSVPFTTRMDTVISWLSKDKQSRPRLITWYMEEPDYVGHSYGPFHPKTGETIQYLDSLVGVFVRKVEKLPDSDRFNMIFTSDHGMGEINGNLYVDIDEGIPQNWIKSIIGHNPVIFMQAEEGYHDSVLHVLKMKQNIRVFEKHTLPEEYNYGTNQRISDIIVEADSGWSIGIAEKAGFQTGGAHGYSPLNTDMHAIFYAKGPAFKKAWIQPAFKNVDLYVLISEILGIKPEKTDGDPARISGMFAE